MNIELKSYLSEKKTLLILTVLAFVCAIISCVFGELLLPVLIAICALVFTFDNSINKIYSLVTAISVLASNAFIIVLSFVSMILDFDVLNQLNLSIAPSFFGIAAVVCAFILYLSFVHGWSKTDTAYTLTIICSLFIALSLIVLPMVNLREFSLDAVSKFYSSILEFVRPYLQGYIQQIYKSIEIQITLDDANIIIDSIIRLVVSFVFIGAFFIVGLSMKLYKFILLMTTSNKEMIDSWRFMPTPIFAYFYAIIGVSIMFVQNTTDVLGITLFNLEYIFMFIFAYVGFNFISAALARKISPLIAFSICAVAIVLLSSFAIQILSYVGVMFVLVKDKQEKFGKMDSK